MRVCSQLNFYFSKHLDLDRNHVQLGFKPAKIKKLVPPPSGKPAVTKAVSRLLFNSNIALVMSYCTGIQYFVVYYLLKQKK